MANRRSQKNNKSGFRGVSWDKVQCRWVAQIKVNKRHIHLDRFDDEIKAARAYNEAAKTYFGEFASLNPV